MARQGESLILFRNRSRQPFVLSKAAGAFLWDDVGNRYFDLCSGWNVVNAGWNNPEIDCRRHELAEDSSFCPSWAKHTLEDKLLSLFAGHFSHSVCIPSCTGSEAVDNALKVARQLTGRHKIITFAESYHGSTLGAAMCAGYETVQLASMPLLEPAKYLPLPVDLDETGERGYIESLEESIRQVETPAAIIFEPLLTNAGCIELPNRAFTLIHKLSRELGFLTICDEIGTGMSRTGEHFGFMSLGFVPDIVLLGKALSNGLYPVSATLAIADVMDNINREQFDSTFAWAPNGVAAAIATMEYHVKHLLPQRAEALGAKVRSLLARQLEDLPIVNGITGRGLELAIHLDWDLAYRNKKVSAHQVVRSLNERNLFVAASRHDESVMVLPVLTATEPDLIEAIELLAGSLMKVFN
jgi:4-aminobutyrate aminotransferase/(S)-3-amino-2-methylpropionate transaminase